MVPLSFERRHRIHASEVPEVIEGLRLRLRKHLEKKDDIYEATQAFKALYRLETHRVGKPNYPSPITWGLIEDWVSARAQPL
jgi:hypothetical protein